MKPPYASAKTPNSPTGSATERRRRVLRWLAWVPVGWMAGCQSVPLARWTQSQRTALRELGFTPDGDEWDLNLGTSLLFDFDSDQLKPDQVVRLSDIGRRLREIGVPSMRVEGHTDTVGEPSYNRELSYRRAYAVARVLQQAGWSSQQIVARGFGPRYPIADNSTAEGRAQNRRVTLIVSAA